MHLVIRRGIRTVKRGDRDFNKGVDAGRGFPLLGKSTKRKIEKSVGKKRC